GGTVRVAGAANASAGAVVAVITAEIVFAPVAIATWHVERAAVPWIVASGLLELLYFVLLAAAYSRAPLSVVYPIARGAAPVLVLLISAVVLGHSTTLREAAAVGTIVVGIVLVRGLGHPDRTGLLFGIAIAGCIAGYTLVDKQGIQHAAPIPYLELTMIIPCLYFARHVRRAAIARGPVVGGIAAFTAYVCVLAALERASAASVAAVRET